MNDFSMNAPNVVSASTTDMHRFPWKWHLADLASVPQNGRRVFSCFSCGGGSTMGYKLAGYQVIGNCEIDPDMMAIYRENHHPRFPFLMDIRDFLALPNDQLPSELFELDILDGSPPCSVFSTAGLREKAWNREKKFREGQKAQRLDDLFAQYIALARRLQPKVIVAENVKGLILGNAKGYVNEIMALFHQAGYDTQLFLLNAARMGVPQRRERVFFIARRRDLHFSNLTLNMCEPPIPFGQVRSDKGAPLGKDSKYRALLERRRPSDRSISDINERVYGKTSGFNNAIDPDGLPCSTIVSGGMHFRMCDGCMFTREDFIAAQTFPQDYNFGTQSPQYVCGMSVPPVMMAHIAYEISRQWFGAD